MSREKQSNIKTIVSGVMIATLFGKILGFLKELVLAYYFGAGKISDAYLVSQTIPGTLFMIIGTGIATCYIPIYIKVKSEEGKSLSDSFTNKFITIIICISIVMTMMVGTIPGLFVKVFAVGFDSETFSYAVQFTRINSISLVFSGLLYCFSALLQAENKYYHVAISNIPYSIGLILAIVIGFYLNVYALAVVSVIAVIIQLVYQIIFVKKIPYNLRLDFRLKDSRIKSSLMLLPPIVLGVAAAEINTLIDRTIASAIVIGGITVITYGTSLFNLIIGVFSNSISAVYYPTISEAVVKKNQDLLQKTVQDSVFLALFFLLPCTTGSVVLRKEIVQLLFGHGEFGASHVDSLSIVFACYSIGFIPFAIKQILNNVFYSNEKTKKPMINTVISVVINIILNLILSNIIGLAGLAVSTGISAIVVAILLIIDCKKDFDIGIVGKPKDILLLAVSAIIMSAVCFAIKMLTSSNSVHAILIVVIGAFVYFVITNLFKVCPLKINLVKRRS